MKVFVLALAVALLGIGAIQQQLAFDYQSSNTVTLPLGDTRIAAPIVIGNSGTLRGTFASNSPIGSTIYNDGPGPAVIIPAEARFVTIENLRIVCGPSGQSGIATHKAASNYSLRNIYITGCQDNLTVGESNFLGKFENVFSDRARRHGFDIGSEWGGTGTTLTFVGCFARWSGSWGMIFRNQWGLSVISSAADVNKDGGMFFRRTAGTAVSPTAESNPLGFWFWHSRMVVLAPTTDGSLEAYRREPNVSVANIISSELNAPSRLQ